MLRERKKNFLIKYPKVGRISKKNGECKQLKIAKLQFLPKLFSYPRAFTHPLTHPSLPLPNYTLDLPHKWSHINSARSLSTPRYQKTAPKNVGKNGASPRYSEIMKRFYGRREIFAWKFKDGSQWGEMGSGISLMKGILRNNL